MLKGLWGYVLFLVLSVGAAYWASTSGGERDELAKEWFTVEAKDLAAMSFKEPGLDVAITTKPFGYWLTVSEEKKKEGGEPETRTDSFKANADIKDLESGLAPFMAQRVIGDADKVDLKEFGLDGDTSAWSITTKAGKNYKFRVGHRSYGSRNVFLLDEDKKQVLMIAGVPLELLRNARTRLFEREVIYLDNDKLKKATINFGEAQAVWALADKDQFGVPQWREDKDGATPQASYKGWMDKVLKTKVQRFANEEEQTALVGVQPFLTVAFLGDRGEIAKMAFKKYGEAPEAKGQPAVWVESSFLGVPVQISQNRALPIEKDLDAILKNRT